jgi:4-hydroxybenzoate polyprenyltransferase/phosphoserine phosphatase
MNDEAEKNLSNLLLDLPLVIDLDGTLLRSDMLFETSLIFLKANPHRSFLLVLWLIKGRPYLKEKLAIASALDVSLLPYDAKVIDLINQEKMRGRKIVMATATHRVLGEKIAKYLGVFDEVIATDLSINLTSELKRQELVRRFGEYGFDYAGNSNDDLLVWKSARHAIVVNPLYGVERKALSQGNVLSTIKHTRLSHKDWATALRFHQWLKNLLIFVPLLAAHRLAEPNLIFQGLLAFFVFGLCASSVYLLNDLLDLEDDRRHPSKRHRPFAAGNLSLKSGIVVLQLLLVSSFFVAALLLPYKFMQVLFAYYVLTLMYSCGLKRLMMVDTVLLALLYTLRVIAGSAVFEINITFWMLAFSMFIFFSLALVKRYAELRRLLGLGHTGKSAGRGYFTADLEMIASMGCTSGFISVLVLALYINDLPRINLYSYPELVWLACPLLLFWVGRIWLIAHRGEMNDDPLVFALRDQVSLFVGALFGLVFWAAS